MPAVLKTATLGCKVNQYETQYLQEGLTSIGYQLADERQPADLCVVNTCTVTNEGDAKSRQLIRRLARENPGARIIVMGCYATRQPHEVARLPGVSEVVTDKRELPDLLGRFGVVDIPTGISRFHGRSRAYIKVQDGCMLRCSYCIIPQVRPQLTSRPMSHILEEVDRLLDNGYRELVLTGIHLGHYGVDWNRGRPKHDWTRLSHLVQRIVDREGDFRVRLSSIEATEVTGELVDVMAAHPAKVCPHLHVCLQSGSDSILRRMRRRWSARMFVDRCQLIRDRLDLPALTTDVIIGFPGESDEQFQQTCDVVREVGFSKIHIFPFSPRRGTPAAEMAQQVSKEVKSQRSQQLAAIEQQLRQEYCQQLVGRRMRVLVESACDELTGHVLGTSDRYAPVELPVNLPGDEQLIGRLVDVRVQAVSGSRLLARLVSTNP